MVGVFNIKYYLSSTESFCILRHGKQAFNYDIDDNIEYYQSSMRVYLDEL